MPSQTRALTQRTGLRLVVCSILGVVVAFVVTGVGPGVMFALMSGWGAGAVAYIVWLWSTMRRFDEHGTSSHAQEEDPSQAGSEAVVLLATMASLAGVGFLLAAANSHHDGAEAVLGTASVAASWLLVHLTYTARYARMYYGDGPGARGIEFDGGEPDYYDFAYVAFDLGMTYQIADTNLKNRQMRRVVLGHMLLSYVLGVGVVATAINLVTSLASS